MLFFSGEADLLGLKARIVVSLDVGVLIREVDVCGPRDGFIFYGALLWKKIVVFDS